MTFNQRDTIEEAIQSVLNQTELPYELVILDDCSADGTPRAAEELLRKQSVFENWRVVRNEVNLGIPRNTKRIADVTQGNVVTHLSGDDYLSPKTVEVVRGRLTELGINPDSDLFLSVGPIKHFDGNKETVVSPRLLGNNLLRSAIIKTFPFVKVGCSARLMRVANYPIDIGLWGDWVWDVDICSQEEVFCYLLALPLYNYRLGSGVGASTPSRKIQASYLNAAKIIYKYYKNQIGFREKLYLLGEISYFQSKLYGGVTYSLAGLVLFMVNTLVLHDVTLFKSTLVRYIPKAIFQ